MTYYYTKISYKVDSPNPHRFNGPALEQLTLLNHRISVVVAPSKCVFGVTSPFLPSLELIAPCLCMIHPVSRLRT